MPNLLTAEIPERYLVKLTFDSVVPSRGKDDFCFQIKDAQSLGKFIPILPINSISIKSNIVYLTTGYMSRNETYTFFGTKDTGTADATLSVTATLDAKPVIVSYDPLPNSTINPAYQVNCYVIPQDSTFTEGTTEVVVTLNSVDITDDCGINIETYYMYIEYVENLEYNCQYTFSVDVEVD